MSFIDRESDIITGIEDKQIRRSEIYEINKEYPVLNKSFYISMDYEEINEIISTSERIIVICGKNTNNIIVNKVFDKGIRCIDVIKILINENFKPENENLFYLESIRPVNKADNVDTFKLNFEF